MSYSLYDWLFGNSTEQQPLDAEHAREIAIRNQVAERNANELKLLEQANKELIEKINNLLNENCRADLQQLGRENDIISDWFIQEEADVLNKYVKGKQAYHDESVDKIYNQYGELNEKTSYLDPNRHDRFCETICPQPELDLDELCPKEILEELRPTALAILWKVIRALFWPFGLASKENPFWSLVGGAPAKSVRAILMLTFFCTCYGIILPLILKAMRSLYRLIKLDRERKLMEKLREEDERRQQRRWFQRKEEEETQSTSDTRINKNTLDRAKNKLESKFGENSIKNKLKDEANLLKSALNKLNWTLDDLNNPFLQVIQISKIVAPYTLVAPKNLQKGTKKKFLESKIAKLKPNLNLKFKPKLNFKKLKFKKLKSKLNFKKVSAVDFISAGLGWFSLGMTGVTAMFRREFFESERLKPLDDFETGVRIERSIQYYEELNSPKLISSENSEVPVPKGKVIRFPGTYFDEPYYISVENSREEVNPSQSSEFEIESYIYTEDITGNNNRDIQYIESDSNAESINIGKTSIKINH